MGNNNEYPRTNELLITAFSKYLTLSLGLHSLEITLSLSRVMSVLRIKGGQKLRMYDIPSSPKEQASIFVNNKMVLKFNLNREHRSETSPSFLIEISPGVDRFV